MFKWENRSNIIFGQTKKSSNKKIFKWKNSSNTIIVQTEKSRVKLLNESQNFNYLIAVYVVCIHETVRKQSSGRKNLEHNELAAEREMEPAGNRSKRIERAKPTYRGCAAPGSCRPGRCKGLPVA
jgi:hypothetical protein